MLGILGWLCGSRPGRILAAIVLGVGLAAAAAAWLLAKGAGQAEQRLRLEAAMATAAALARRVAVDRDLQGMAPAARRDELRRWARDRTAVRGLGADPAEHG